MWWCTPLISAQKKVALYEFKVNLVYRVSSRMGSVATEKPCLQRPKKEKKKEREKGKKKGKERGKGSIDISCRMKVLLITIKVVINLIR